MSKEKEFKVITFSLDIDLYNQLGELAYKEDREVNNYIKVLIKKHLNNRELTNTEKALIGNTNLFKPRIIVLMTKNNYSKDEAVEQIYKEKRDKIKEIFNFDDFDQFKNLFKDFKPILVKDDLGKCKVQFE